MSTTLEEIGHTLLTFIREEFVPDARYHVELDTPLWTSGILDSFNVVQLAMFIEERFGILIADTEFGTRSLDTLRRLATRISEGECLKYQ